VCGLALVGSKFGRSRGVFAAMRRTLRPCRCRELSDVEFKEDALILAGDVSDDQARAGRARAGARRIAEH